MLKKNKKAFSLVELLLVMAIIAIASSALFTGIWLQQRGRDREKFITRLNATMRLAWQQTMITNKLHRVVFDFKKKNARVEVATTTKDGKQEFALVRGTFVPNRFKWESAIDIKQFIIDGQDKIAAGAGHKTIEVWFYIVPGGIAQSVTINFIEQQGQKKRPTGLVLNIFNAQFKAYDSFQK